MPFSTVPTHASKHRPPGRASIPIFGLGVTALSLVAVTLLKLLFWDYVGPATPFLLYFASIMTAAWFDGWRGGVIVTGISALLGTYFFLPPFSTIALQDRETGVRLCVFLVEGIAITWITARLRTESERARSAAQRAKSSLAKLEAVLRGVTDGITVQSARGELIYANDGAARLSGFDSASEMLAAPVSEILSRFELLDPDGGPFDLSQLPGRRALQGLPAPERLVRFRMRATGEERYTLVRANAVHIDDMEGLVAVNVFQDVTETRQQQEALRVSQEWLSTTLQSIGDAVIATDASGGVTFMNLHAEQLTGWSSAQARGRPLPEIFKIVDEETREPVPSPVDRVLEAGSVVGLANHTILIARDGSEIAIDDSAAPIRSSKGELVGTVLVFRNVSERRANERRRAFVARATGELAVLFDREQTLSTVARLAVPAIADWCAIDMHVDGKLQRLAVEHVDPEKVQLLHEVERRYPEAVLRSGEPVFLERISDEARVEAAQDDQLQPQSYIAVPLATGDSILGVLSLAMAESGRHYGQPDLELALALADRAALALKHAQLFEEATAARSEAERANRSKDEFLAMLGHELRNPLAPMLTALHLMKLRAPDAVERERAILERQVKHVVVLVEDLLDVSRITSGKIELVREPVDLSDTLAKSLELTAPLLEERRHEVVTDFPQSLYVAGDPVRLAQVLSNLISNAAKYSEPGGRIEISGRRQDESVIVRVRDNGVGIHPDLLPSVFNLFVQGRQSIDRAQGGLGLGLAIVKNVVELHGGVVHVDSDGPGRGSEFRVVLPALSPPTSERAPGPAHPRSFPPASRIKVLVVDDNEDALELLAEALVLSGYSAHAALDPATAIAQAELLKPEIALLDIGLPVMDGYELAQRLRAIDGLENLRLVAITGYGQPADKERARAAGFDEHLVKPVSLDAVRQVVERLSAEPLG